MNRGPSRRLLAVLFAGALLATACGDDDDASAGEEVEETTTTTEATTTTTTTEAPPDPAEVEAEVSATIEGFFAALGEGRHDDAAALLENGEAHTAEFQSFSDLAVGVSAQAKSVEVLDPETALYTIDILVNGEVALPDSSGEAVLVEGTWLMSEDSWNALAALAPAE